MTNLREIWEARSTELHDRLALEGGKRGEEASGMIPKVLACEAEWMMLPFTDFRTPWRSRFEYSETSSNEFQVIAYVWSFGSSQLTAMGSVVHHSVSWPLNS